MAFYSNEEEDVDLEGTFCNLGGLYFSSLITMWLDLTVIYVTICNMQICIDSFPHSYSCFIGFVQNDYGGHKEIHFS